jgi:hypothetical protein
MGKKTTGAEPSLRSWQALKHVARMGEIKQKQNKLRGFNPPANYTDRATAACRRSYCQL